MKLKKLKKREVIAPDWMIIDAVRYAVGRKSYQVAITTDWLRDNFKKLPEGVKFVIWQDLKGDIERDKGCRLPKFEPLGDKHNRLKWIDIFEVINGEMQRVQKVGGDSKVS